MKERWIQLLARIDTLTLRERVFLLATVLAVFIGLWYLVLMTPLGNQQTVARNELKTLNSQLVTLNKAIQNVIVSSQRDPDAQNREQLALVEADIHQLDEKLKELTANLISPAQMTSVLEAVLSHQHGLRLLRVQSTGNEPLLTGDAVKPGSQANVYRHGLELTFEGKYADTLAYLKALQKLKWKFYWDGLQLDVLHYPENRIVLRVHTLSLREGWIGV